MIQDDKTKAELIMESQNLQHEYDVLKEIFSEVLALDGQAKQTLMLANEELDFQNTEKAKRAAELVMADIELAFQNDEKNKRALEYNQLSHLSNMFVGREMKMIELKKEVNELLILHGGAAKYEIFD